MQYVWVIFVILAIPIALLAALVRGNFRKFCLYILLAQVLSLFSSYLTSFLAPIFADQETVNFVFVPLIEEAVKVIPIVIVYYLSEEDDFESLLPFALTIGIVFGFMENCFYLFGQDSQINFIYVILRTFGAGILHALLCFLFLFNLTNYASKLQISISVFVILGSYFLIYAIHAIFNLLTYTGFELLAYVLLYCAFFANIFIRLVYERRVIQDNNKRIDFVLKNDLD